MEKSTLTDSVSGPPHQSLFPSFLSFFLSFFLFSFFLCISHFYFLCEYFFLFINLIFTYVFSLSLHFCFSSISLSHSWTFEATNVFLNLSSYSSHSVLTNLFSALCLMNAPTLETFHIHCVCTFQFSSKKNPFFHFSFFIWYS